MPQFRELFWKDARAEHMELKHGVNWFEVTEAFETDEHYFFERTHPSEKYPEVDRYKLYCRTEVGRHLIVILDDMGDGIAAPVTAREMKRRERSKYRARVR